MFCTVTTSGLCLGSWKRTSELHMEVTMTLSTQMGELVAVFPGSSLHGSKRFCHHTGRRGRGNLRLKLVS